MIWTRSVQDLNTFTSFLNNIHPTVKFTCDFSFTSIPFSMSTSHFKMTAKSSLVFTPNLPTNTNTYYCAFVMSSHTCPVLSLSVTFHSIGLDSVAFVQPTRPSHSTLMSLSTIFTNVAITAISFKGNKTS